MIPMMTLQSLIAKLMGVVIIVLVCIFYCEGTMSALNAITMVIAAFIIYTSLETAGNYSALIRVIDIYVQRAQEILDTPQMNISGDFLVPRTCDLSTSNIEFFLWREKGYLRNFCRYSREKDDSYCRTFGRWKDNLD